MGRFVRSAGFLVLILVLTPAITLAAPFTFTELANSSSVSPSGGTFTSYRWVQADGSIGYTFFATNSGTVGSGIYHHWLAPPTDPFQKKTDSNTNAPDGSGKFTSFSNLAWQKFLGAFNGTTVTQTGVYTVTSNGTMNTAANRNTIMPGGTVMFDTFGKPAISAPAVTANMMGFSAVGVGGADRGIFRYTRTTNILTRLVSGGASVPGGSPGEVFATFGDAIRFDGTALAFVATTSAGGVGIYVNPQSGAQFTAVDETTPVPGGGSFTGFDPGDFRFGAITFRGTVSGGANGLFRRSPVGALTNIISVGSPLGSSTASALGDSIVYFDSTLFQASLASGGSGIYLNGPGGTEKILAAGDTLGTGTVQDVFLGALDPNKSNRLFFNVTFSDGKQSIYSVLVPEPAGAALLVPLAALLLRRRGG